MTQEEVTKIMEKEPEKWWTTGEISNILGTNIGSVVRCLNAMYKYGEVRRKPFFRSDYKWNIRNRYYWQIK